jgi:O-antigen/teichoic acid export membrane protein
MVTDAVLAGGPQAPSARDGAGRSLAVGTTCAILVAAAAVAVGSPYLAVAGFALPGLVLYDYSKAVSLGAGRPGLACRQEAWWAALTVVAALLGMLRVVDAVVVFSMWAGAGVLIGGLAARRRGLGLFPVCQLERGEARAAAGFGIQYMVTTGSAHLALIVAAAGAGTAVVGALSAARVVFGPVNILLGTASALMVPYLSRFAEAAGQVKLRRALRVVALVVGSAAPLALVVATLPDVVGLHLLGPNWENAQPLLPALALESLLAVAATVGFAGHRVEWATFRALLIGTVLGLVRVPAILAGAVLLGERGAAAAMVVMAAVSSAAWWSSYLALIRRRRAGRLTSQPAEV